MRLIFPYEKPKDGKGQRRVFTKAQGYQLWDSSGSEYIDGISGTWHINFGYTEPSLLKALEIPSGTQSSGTLVTLYTSEAEELAEKLTDYLDLKNYSVFLTNSGAEGIEVARWITKKALERMRKPGSSILSIPGGFHGTTSGNKEILESSIDISKILEQPLSKKTNVIYPGAIIYEPVQTGVRFISQELAKYIKHLQSNGTLIIADEVGCGLGRIGKRVASLHHQIKPDVLVVSKGLTGGLVPLAATLVSPMIRELLNEEVIEYAHTNAGSPICCRIALATLSLMETEKVIKNMERVELQLKELVETLANEIGSTYRHIGLLAAVQLPRNKPLGFEERQELYGKFLSHGVILRVSPADGISVPFVPGFTYSLEDFKLLKTKALHAFRDICRL